MSSRILKALAGFVVEMAVMIALPFGGTAATVASWLRRR